MIKPYVEIHGEGPDLVLLHGWGLHGEIFAGILPVLSEHYRVHVVDIPGFGRSPIANADYTLALLIEQITAVVPRKAHWLGWSMGGMIAMATAIHRPDCIDKLVTVAASPKFTSADDWVYATKAEVLDGFLEYLQEDFRGTLIRFLAIQTLGSETQKEDLQMLKEVVFSQGEPAKKALESGLELLKNTDLRKQLKSIKQPWLRIYGRLDGLVPVKSEAEVSLLAPKSQSHIFRKSSHGPFISHKDDFLDVCLKFLSAARTSDKV